jgi:hypothetical protein
MNSYRESFRKTPHVNGWNDVVDSVKFKAAADAAMLHFGALLQKPTTMEHAAANEYRRQGAQAFLDVLMNLAEENKTNQQNERSTLRSY